MWRGTNSAIPGYRCYAALTADGSQRSLIIQDGAASCKRKMPTAHRRSVPPGARVPLVRHVGNGDREFPRVRSAVMIEEVAPAVELIPVRIAVTRGELRQRRKGGVIGVVQRLQLLNQRRGIGALAASDVLPGEGEDKGAPRIPGQGTRREPLAFGTVDPAIEQRTCVVREAPEILFGQPDRSEQDSAALLVRDEQSHVRAAAVLEQGDQLACLRDAFCGERDAGACRQSGGDRGAKKAQQQGKVAGSTGKTVVIVR